MSQPAGGDATSDDAGTVAPASSHLEVRRELYEQFGPSQVAYSADGRDVGFMGPVDAGLGVGGFAVVAAGSGPTDELLVVQVRELRLVEREGPELTVDLHADSPSLPGRSALVRPLLRGVVGHGGVLGTLAGGSFSAHDQSAPFGERSIRPATPEEVRVVVDGLDRGSPSIEIGVLRQTPEVTARLRSKGFARHTFMCGQSGSGKTYTTGALFERLLTGTTLPLIVLDPNSDHVHLGAVQDPTDTSEEARRFRAAAESVRVVRARGFEASHTLCADFSDLPVDAQALLLRLHPVADADEFSALRRLTATLAAPYSARDVMDAAEQRSADDPLAARIHHRIDNLGIADWTLWRRDDETSIVHIDLRGERCVVVDLGSLPNPDERTAVALTLLGTRWRRRGDRTPVLIAIDEAHNILPAVTDDPLLQAATDLGILIAGEGRKFGLHLFIATQRPAKVHPHVVSQCDNLLLMRMNGAGDVDDLVSLFSHVPEGMIREAFGFGLGHALFAGPIAPTPMFARVGTRLSPEGGGDVPTTWVAPPA